jgi:hypothetical protein
MDAISLINPDVFFSVFSSSVMSTFDTLINAAAAGVPMVKALTWSEAELALHLLYIFKGTFDF